MPSNERGPREPIAGADSGPTKPFPLKLNGRVIQGFGRGSKELGIPTANIPIEGLTVGGHDDVESGVYFGWAGLSDSAAVRAHPPGDRGEYTLMQSHIYDHLSQQMAALQPPLTDVASTGAGAVYPMVMSIGYNPVYKNPTRSVEVHVMNQFESDFYDTHMNLIITGLIRGELDYTSKEALIEDIKTDIDVAGRSLAREPYLKLAQDPYLVQFTGRSDVAS